MDGDVLPYRVGVIAAGDIRANRRVRAGGMLVEIRAAKIIYGDVMRIVAVEARDGILIRKG